jgi:hypothetical protein
MIYGNPVTLCEKMYVTPQKEIRKQTRDADTGEENCLQYLDGECLCYSVNTQRFDALLQATVSVRSIEVFLTYQKVIIEIGILTNSLTPWRRVLDN